MPALVLCVFLSVQEVMQLCLLAGSGISGGHAVKQWAY